MSKAPVLDTAALLSWPPQKIMEGIALPDQLIEVERFSPERALLFEVQGPKWMTPSPEFLIKAENMARSTGDLPALSRIDLALLAIALETNGELITDDYRLQNCAKSAGLKARSVMTKGIKKGWVWELQCTGCGKREEGGGNQGEVKDCDICGSPCKVVKRRG